MWGDPEPDCWLHPGVDVRPSALSGVGLFARDALPRGTEVSRLGGRLVSGAELREVLGAAATSGTGYVDTITVDGDRHLVLPPDRPNGKGNHSCDPNLWWVAPYTLGTRRDVAAGEELTNDYATSTGVADFVMPCRCGSPICRQLVTGDDWRLVELQHRYGDHWVPALLNSRARRRHGDLGGPPPAGL